MGWCVGCRWVGWAVWTTGSSPGCTHTAAHPRPLAPPSPPSPQAAGLQSARRWARGTGRMLGWLESQHMKACDQVGGRAGRAAAVCVLVCGVSRRRPATRWAGAGGCCAVLQWRRGRGCVRRSLLHARPLALAAATQALPEPRSLAPPPPPPHPPPTCTALPQDLGGCGVRNSVTYRLARLPRVFTLQLAWESNQEGPDKIAATLAAVDETVRCFARAGSRCQRWWAAVWLRAGPAVEAAGHGGVSTEPLLCLVGRLPPVSEHATVRVLPALACTPSPLLLPRPTSPHPPFCFAPTLPQVDPSEFYKGVPPRLYRLHSLVCYYGAHYSAFVWAADLGAWLQFDDTRVTRVGSWADVRAKCQAGRIQPSLLFYEAAAA